MVTVLAGSLTAIVSGPASLRCTSTLQMDTQILRTGTLAGMAGTDALPAGPLAAMAGTVEGQGRTLAPIAALTKLGSFTTSETCGRCHTDIYRMWRASAHSRSMEDPLFLDAFRETETREGPAVTRRCLGCHAPMVQVNGDNELRQKITWEGVSCDICHSLISVDLSGPSPKLVLEAGPVKRGPIRGAESMAHEVAYSELHTTALACAGCHEYANPDGTGLITTYSEWKHSEAAHKGQICQSCHMGRTHADVVDPRVKRIAGAKVNLHEVPGGHSLDQLHKALGLSIRTKREGDGLVLEIVLTNKGAGHAVPTGMPGRRVVLDVRVKTSDGTSFEERRVYGRVFNDALGKTITRDSGYFTKGASLVSDSRLRAGESRTESFRFTAPRSATAYVTVHLVYEHAPGGVSDEKTRVVFQSEERIVKPETVPGV